MNAYCNNPKIGFWGQLGMIIGLTIVGLIVGALLSAVCWKMLTHTSLLSMQQNLSNPAFADAIKIIQCITTFLGFFVPAMMYAIIVANKPVSFIGFSSRISGYQVGLVIALVVIALLASGSLAELNRIIPISKKLALEFQQAEDAYLKQVSVIASFKTWADYGVALVIIAALPALFEELFFRGMMQQFFENWIKIPWVAIVLTSIIFSAVHGSYYGFLARAGLGLILGYIFYFSRNIWLNILLHFCNNAIAITVMFIANSIDVPKPNKPAIDDGLPVWWLLLIIPVAVFIFKKLKAEGKKLGVEQQPNLMKTAFNPFENHSTSSITTEY